MQVTKSKFVGNRTVSGQTVAFYIYTYVGLQADAKPTLGVCEGSTFFEEDTSKIFMMKADGSWVEI